MIQKNVTHIRTLKQALNHGLILRKVHRVIKLFQRENLKPYIDMNTKLRADAKTDFGKYFLKLMNNSVFWKTTEIVGKHRDIKLVTTYKKRSYVVSELSYSKTVSGMFISKRTEKSRSKKERTSLLRSINIRNQ